jgi:hypothetical protein
MVIPLKPARGGGHHDRQNPGLFIRDFLSNQDAAAHDIFVAYKKSVQADISPEYRASVRKKLRASILRGKRTHPHERVKVEESEIDARMDDYLKEHKPRFLRHACSYNSFQHYIYVLKELGLIDYTGTTETADGKGGTPSTEWHETHPAVNLRIVKANDPAWSNLWAAYHAR